MVLCRWVVRPPRSHTDPALLRPPRHMLLALFLLMLPLTLCFPPTCLHALSRVDSPAYAPSHTPNASIMSSCLDELSKSGSSINADSARALSLLFIAAGSDMATLNSTLANYTLAYRCFISALRIHPYSTEAVLRIAGIAPNMRRIRANGASSASASNVLYYSCSRRLVRLGYFHRPDGSIKDEEKAREFFNVIMSVDELSILHHLLLPLRETGALFFEFGIGGSTRYARSLLPAAQIAGLDGSKEWVDALLREMPELAARLRWIDIGPTASWGHPVRETEQHNAHLFPAYSAAIYEWANKSSIGLVLIDGRFRVACAAAAALALPPRTRVLVHDYARRPYYAEIQTALQLLNVVDSLAVFEVWGNAEAAEAARQLYEKFKLDAR
jgi:hypothetical protein